MLTKFDSWKKSGAIKGLLLKSPFWLICVVVVGVVVVVVLMGLVKLSLEGVMFRWLFKSLIKSFGVVEF